ncbi:MAG: pilQ [Deltaproteobacteria bacterium]|nr:pilQ [Deltaproteobacteria bacterium]
MKRIFLISSLTILMVLVLFSFFPNPESLQGAKEPAADSAPVSGFLRDVVIDSQPREVRVKLTGDGLTADYRSFTLSQPSRLVIDFPGVLTSFPKKFLDVGHPLLKDIRFGQYPDKLRLVLTSPATEFPSRRIIREAGGLTILVGMIEKVPKEKKPASEEKQETGRILLPREKSAPGKPPSLTAVPPAKTPEEKKTIGVPEKPEAEKPSVKIYSGEKITLDFVEADIRRVFAHISEVAQRQIVPSPQVQGTITLRLIDVPWDQALDAILSIYNLKRVDDRNIIRILPGGKS